MKIKTWAIVLIAVLFAAAVVNATVRNRQEPGISWTWLSTDTQPTAAVNGVTPKAGDIGQETDTGLKWLYNGSSWGRMTNVVTKTDTVSYTTAGVTAAFASAGIKALTTSITVNSDTIGAQLQGKKIGNDWGTVDNSADSTLILNKTVNLTFLYPSHFDSMRVKITHKNGTGRSVFIGFSKEWK